MNSDKRYFLLYGFLYGAIALITVLGLVVNINTLLLSQKNLAVKQSIQQLDERNQVLQLQIEKALSLNNIEEIAKTKLSMVEPKETVYLEK